MHPDILPAIVGPQEKIILSISAKSRDVDSTGSIQRRECVIYRSEM